MSTLIYLVTLQLSIHVCFLCIILATKRLPFDQNSSNPKLEKLQEMILRAYRGEEKFKNSRGIVFVKTRDLATAIVSWMNETPGLKPLNAIKFVGQNESADKGGISVAN